MHKHLGTFLAVALMALPVTASAATSTAQLESLYAKLIALLTQELQMLKDAQTAKTGPQLVIDSPKGTVPYAALITLPYLDGTEAVDYGDGHSTGSNGCMLNAGGFCALGHQLAHTYVFPGMYTVTLYRRSAGEKDSHVVTTRTVTVEAAQQR